MAGSGAVRPGRSGRNDPSAPSDSAESNAPSQRRRSVREVIDDLVLSNSVRRGVIGLMKTLSREFAPAVRTNAVMPGAHETGRIEELVEAAVERGDHPDYEAGLADWSEGVPVERVGEPRELGETVAWLSSDRASYLNGAAVPVDGGATRSV